MDYYPYLTIFTSTYNRAYTLRRTYDSLRRQSCTDFEWIVVDDGSTDNTEQLVHAWEKDHNSFSIRYFKKANEGFHTGYNTAIANMNSVLAVCIDSDDYMPEDAVQKICECWQVRGSNEFGGIIGLDYDTQGRLIGGILPKQQSINLIDLAMGKLPVRKGDKKIVVRTDLYKQYGPMRVFPGEKYFNPHYLHLEISRSYDFLVLNEALCIVDYQTNSMTFNMYKQYRNSPNSFLEIRKQRFSFGRGSLQSELRNGIHFISSALLSKRLLQEWKQSDRKILLLCCLLPGVLLAWLTILKG